VRYNGKRVDTEMTTRVYLFFVLDKVRGHLPGPVRWQTLRGWAHTPEGSRARQDLYNEAVRKVALSAHWEKARHLPFALKEELRRRRFSGLRLAKRPAAFVQSGADSSDGEIPARLDGGAEMLPDRTAPVFPPRSGCSAAPGARFETAKVWGSFRASMSCGTQGPLRRRKRALSWLRTQSEQVGRQSLRLHPRLRHGWCTGQPVETAPSASAVSRGYSRSVGLPANAHTFCPAQAI
jgi:hypothetical protein